MRRTPSQSRGGHRSRRGDVGDAEPREPLGLRRRAARGRRPGHRSAAGSRRRARPREPRAPASKSSRRGPGARSPRGDEARSTVGATWCSASLERIAAGPPARRQTTGSAMVRAMAAPRQLAGYFRAASSPATAAARRSYGSSRERRAALNRALAGARLASERRGRSAAALRCYRGALLRQRRLAGVGRAAEHLAGQVAAQGAVVVDHLPVDDRVVHALRRAGRGAACPAG